MNLDPTKICTVSKFVTNGDELLPCRQGETANAVHIKFVNDIRHIRFDGPLAEVYLERFLLLLQMAYEMGERNKVSAIKKELNIKDPVILG